MKLKLLILLTIVSISTGNIGQDGSVTYRSLIDGYKGFYKVVISGTVEVPLYENYTLNINVGDNIVWVNDDPTDIITIVSEQKLWKNDEVVLGHIGSQFNYTFDEIGTYTFYIKQYQGFPKQTIIVSNSNIVPILTYTVPTYH